MVQTCKVVKFFNLLNLNTLQSTLSKFFSKICIAALLSDK